MDGPEQPSAGRDEASRELRRTTQCDDCRHGIAQVYERKKPIPPAEAGPEDPAVRFARFYGLRSWCRWMSAENVEDEDPVTGKIKSKWEAGPAVEVDGVIVNCSAYRMRSEKR